ncbi:unnamed protein product [Rotaria sp. Silwood2]|nr:unnamed protein product [Rotaria sp. Silwood2]CAF4338382.1 unnamed protein product [Rotaria sp. Silwood2]
MNVLREFFVFTCSNGKKISGECKLCGKLYSDNAGSTGNFHKHMKRKHMSEYDKLKYPDSFVPKNDTYDYSENFEDNVIKINQTILKELIVKCNLPPTLVEHTGFRNFLKAVAPKWKPTSSRYFTKTLLPSLMNNSQEKIRKLLDSIDHLSITVDVWIDRRGRSFIGVTGHFLDLNYIPQALLLDFSRLKGPHTGENIRLVTREILEILKIRDKVYRVITDNAASMIKAYKFGLTVKDDDYTIQDDNNLLQEDTSIEFPGDDDLNMSNEWRLADWCESDKDGHLIVMSIELGIRTDKENNDEVILDVISCYADADFNKEWLWKKWKSQKCEQLVTKAFNSLKATNRERRIQD